MPRKRFRKRRGPNRNKVQKGDLYVVDNDVEIVDVDGDGVADLVATHNVTKNGALFVDVKAVWYGLEEEVVAGFISAIEEAGLLEDFETNRFAKVNRSWKRLTRFISSINKMADQRALEMGEEIED